MWVGNGYVEKILGPRAEVYINDEAYEVDTAALNGTAEGQRFSVFEDRVTPIVELEGVRVQWGATRLAGDGCPMTRSGVHLLEEDRPKPGEEWCRQCGAVFPQGELKTVTPEELEARRARLSGED